MKILRDLYIHPRFYKALGIVILVFVFGMFNQVAFNTAIVAFGLLIVAVITDLQILFGGKGTVQAQRKARQRMSNGDHNVVGLVVTSHLPRNVRVRLIDELPVQFQRRNLEWNFSLSPGSTNRISYSVRPVERGEYHFGRILVFVRSSIGLLIRRYPIEAAETIRVYPSYLQLRHFGFLAFDKRLQHAGLKKIRRLGHTTEFEQIKEYVQGDDTRALNWKATARAAKPMVNQYQDERAQPVYCVIDKGRLMQMPFEGMTLLDHAINAALVMSYIAVHKSDKAGLVTFAQHVDAIVPAGNRSQQMHRILEVLYNQKTDFLEADFERLTSALRRDLRQRSLLLIMTNFESLVGLRRQLPYLKTIAERHVVVVIFFRNTELNKLTTSPATSVREIYHQTLAEKAQFEKELIVRVLRNHGIYAVLTEPEHLTVNTINQYLELKARGVI